MELEQDEGHFNIFKVSFRSVPKLRYSETLYYRK